MEVNRLLIFDLKGSLAHFRKFYTSSSSLSYSFPPRTTLIGIVAAVLGKERDSYYEELDCSACKTGLSIRSPIRKIMQTVNYIRTKEEDGFTKTQGVIKSFIRKQINKYPTPIELVAPSKPNDKIAYRVYFYHSNGETMDGVCSMLQNNKSYYPVFLGISEFIANIEFVADVPSKNIIKHKTEDTADIITVCNSEYVTEFEFEQSGESLQYIEEKMPLEFASGRVIKRTASFIHEKNQKSIKARLNIPYLEVSYTYKEQSLKENITFMD